MKKFVLFALLSLSFCFSLTSVYAGETPQATLKELERGINLRQNPEWSEDRFDNYMTKYLTPELIDIVSKARVIAKANRINLWDANFFTGGQGVVSVHFKGIKVLNTSVDEVIAELKIAQSDNLKITDENYGDFIASLKKIGDSWYLDDIQSVSDEMSRKEHFSSIIE